MCFTQVKFWMITTGFLAGYIYISVGSRFQSIQMWQTLYKYWSGDQSIQEHANKFPPKRLCQIWYWNVILKKKNILRQDRLFLWNIIFRALQDMSSLVDCVLFCLFSVRLLSVLRGHSVFSSPPQRPMISDFERFSIPDCIHYIYFPILIFEKEPVFSLFNVQC